MLSDGTSILIAMVTKQFDKVDVSKNNSFNITSLVQFPKYSVLKLRGNMNVQLVNKRT